MITNGFSPLLLGTVSSTGLYGKILVSGEFITTAIFSGPQLRLEKICLHARLTVTTRCARAMLHFSNRFNSFTLPPSGAALKIVVISSGIGSWRSNTTFAPNHFGIVELTTSTSGMLWTCTKSYLFHIVRTAKSTMLIKMNAEYRNA